MQIEYEQENGINYLILRDVKNIDNREFEIKMLENNEICELLPIHMRKVNGENDFYYNITSLQQLDKFFSYRKMQWEDIVAILKSISAIANEADTYMLNLDSVMVAPEYTYLQIANHEVRFPYCPVEIEQNYCFEKKLQALFEFIMEHMDHMMPQEKVLSVYSAYQKIMSGQMDFCNLVGVLDSQIEKNMEETGEAFEQVVVKDVVPEEIVDEVEQVNLDAGLVRRGIRALCVIIIVVGIMRLLFPIRLLNQIPSVIMIGMMGFATIVFVCAQKIQRERFARIVQQKTNEPYKIVPEKQQGQPAEEKQPQDRNHFEMYSENTIRSDSDYESQPQEKELLEHTMLMQDYYKLQSEKTDILELVYCGEDVEYKNIKIHQSPFLIGSSSTHCDGVIAQTLVSRIHLCITKEDEAWFVEDLNSTNGTYVNGNRLQTNNKQRLLFGDILMIAGLSYKVEMTRKL